jgi:PqqD family protein of HPr-rel-A system
MSISVPTETRWTRTVGSELRWASWDAEEVVYDAASGDTHVLDPITALLLKRLQSTSARTSELADLVAVELKVDSGDELLTRVYRSLVGLRSLSLVDSLSE